MRRVLLFQDHHKSLLGIVHQGLDGQCPAAICGDLEKATRAAFDDASAAIDGGTILLAPAAASFDQFTSFGARGDAFAALAQNLCATNAGGNHA